MRDPRVCFSSHRPLRAIETLRVSYSETDSQIRHPEYDRKLFPAASAASASSSALVASRAIGICAEYCSDNSLLRLSTFRMVC